MQSFTILYVKFHTILSKKMLLSVVVLKLIFNCEAPSTKLHANKIFGL